MSNEINDLENINNALHALVEDTDSAAEDHASQDKTQSEVGQGRCVCPQAADGSCSKATDGSCPKDKCRDCSGCSDTARHKLHCFNWLEDIPGGYADDDMVEVQFKNTRKGYYKNSTGIPLKAGDLVAVEAQPGHDIGTVTLTGALVRLQMRKSGIRPNAETKRVFRKAKPADIDKYNEARAREQDTMIRARKIAQSLQLDMKIGDVEYQGDGNKAIFYYIADARVDFRQLIKVLADTFKIRIEMKQIGARQEAGRIGGIGPCGRPLCCSSWMQNFVSVSTSAARFQDISLNPQKLAGQCAKLKCCLNFEVDTYVETVKRMPPKNVRLETADATWYHFKTDVFKREIIYSSDKSMAANLTTLDAERVFEIIALNKEGKKPATLLRDAEAAEAAAKDRPSVNDLLNQDELTRFDKKKRKKKKPFKDKAPKTPKDSKDSKPSNGDAAQDKQSRPNRRNKKKPRNNGKGNDNQQTKEPKADA